MIDDIRLMNNTDDRYQGFPVKLDDIIKKIYEINPNYKIKYFDDYCAKNDVLVAYIKPQCIHKYLLKCNINPQPPGFGDFLRGTIALYVFSKKYDYSLFIDIQHPIFNYLNVSEYSCIDQSVTHEYLPPLLYQDIYSELENKFKTNTSFSVITNSFYSNNGNLNNFGEITKISEDCANYMKTILSPTLQIKTKILDIFENVYNLNIDSSFNVIHLRFGDNFIFNNEYNNDLYELYYNKINALNKNEKYILISDSSEIAKKLKENIPELLYWDNIKTHSGSMNNNVFDTLVDFFIMSKSNEIFSNQSSFSIMNSIIYNIKYTLI